MKTVKTTTATTPSRRAARGLLGILLLAIGSACDSSRALTSPTPGPVPVPPSVALQLFGEVYDWAIVPIAGAHVSATVVGEAEVRGLTDESGKYRLNATWRPGSLVSITVSTGRHVSQTRATGIPPWGSPAGFVWTLQAPAPQSFAGSYRVTLAASPSCAALPPSVATRSYRAEWTDLGAPRVGALLALEGTFSNGDRAIYMRTSEDYARFGIYRWVGIDEEMIVEQLSDGGYLGVVGQGVARVVSGDARLEALFTGLLEYCPQADGARCAVPITTCQATNHRIVAERVGT